MSVAIKKFARGKKIRALKELFLCHQMSTHGLQLMVLPILVLWRSKNFGRGLEKPDKNREEIR